MTTQQVTDNAVATQEPAAQSAHQPATDGANSGSSNGAKTLTQAQFEHEAGIIRKEAKAVALKDVLGKLGAASLEDLQALIEDARKLKQSQMSEAEKAQAERDAIIKERDALKGQLEQQSSKIREKEIQGAVKDAVTAMKASDFDAIYLWAEKHHAESLNAVIGEDGNVDTKALDKLLEAVKKDKPGYFTPPVQPFGSPSNSGGRVVAGMTETEALKRASRLNQEIIRGRR